MLGTSAASGPADIGDDMDGTDSEGSIPSDQLHTSSGVQDHRTMGEAGTEPEVSTPLDEVHGERDRPPEDGMPLDVLQADQYRPVLTIIAGKRAATPAERAQWLAEEEELRRRWSDPSPGVPADGYSPTAGAENHCTIREAIAWCAYRDERLASRYGAPIDGGDAMALAARDRRLWDTTYVESTIKSGLPGTEALAGLSGEERVKAASDWRKEDELRWELGHDKLLQMLRRGEVRSYRDGEIQRGWWADRTLARCMIAGPRIDRDDLRRALQNGPLPDEKPHPVCDLVEDKTNQPPAVEIIPLLSPPSSQIIADEPAPISSPAVQPKPAEVWPLPTTTGTSRGRGRPAVQCTAAIEAMRHKLSSGEMTLNELENLKHKELPGKFPDLGGVTLLNRARKKVLAISEN
jgi:hypothetical protein